MGNATCSNEEILVFQLYPQTCLDICMRTCMFQTLTEDSSVLMGNRLTLILFNYRLMCVKCIAFVTLG